MTAEERAAQAERDLDLLRHLYNEALRRQKDAIRAAVLAERASCAEIAEMRAVSDAAAGTSVEAEWAARAIAEAIRARCNP